jgi:hypothetical protein
MSNKSKQSSPKNYDTERIISAVDKIGEKIENMGDKIDNMGDKIISAIDKLDNRFDKLYQLSINRIARIENQQTHIDKGVENLITNSVKDWLKSLATKMGYKLTIKVGNKFLKNLKNPADSGTQLTEFDGCFILSNDVTNTKYADKSHREIRDKKYMSLEKETKTYREKIRMSNAAKLKPLQDRYQRLLSTKSKLDDEVIEEEIDKIITQIELQQIESSLLPNKRCICIVEAKTYVSSYEIAGQFGKMMTLLDYFYQVSLLHSVRDNKDQYDIAMATKRWSQDFIQVNKDFNLRFDGVYLFLGGSYMVESYAKDHVKLANAKLQDAIYNKIISLKTLYEKTQLFDIKHEIDFYENIMANIYLVCGSKQDMAVFDVTENSETNSF